MFTTPRLMIGAGMLLMLTLAVGWLWKTAGDSTLQSIERQDNAAGNSSDSARARFDGCPVGMWDFATGKCRRP